VEAEAPIAERVETVIAAALERQRPELEQLVRRRLDEELDGLVAALTEWCGSGRSSVGGEPRPAFR
jgi:hypothetical protein